MSRASIIYLVIAAVMACAVQSCTNGGDIGPLYGEWAMVDYTVDGHPADIRLDEYFWQFQSEIICIVTILPHNDFLYTFGTWRRSGDVLSLNFTHTSADEIPESSVYNPPPELGIPSRAVTDMDIITLSAKEMTLSFTDPAGIKKTYRLKKLK